MHCGTEVSIKRQLICINNDGQLTEYLGQSTVGCFEREEMKLAPSKSTEEVHAICFGGGTASSGRCKLGQSYCGQTFEFPSANWFSRKQLDPKLKANKRVLALKLIRGC